MANEFKIRKGLIVEGASGGTVVDVQGSQGRLFSVTDDLSGSIFAVSDISGVPILDVNSSGLSTFDGAITSTSNIESQDTFILNYNNAGNKWQQLFDGANGWNLRYYNSTTQAWSSNYVNVNTSGNATFAGALAVQGTGDSYFTGNVGIGATNPSAKLEVQADVTTNVDVVHFSNSNSVAKAKISLSANSSGELSLIDGNNNTDVFISSNGNSYFNGGNLGIGTTSPGTKLHVGAGSGATVDTGYQAVIDSAGIAGLQILSATTQSGRIVFGDSDDNDIGMIKYDHTDNSMGFRTNGSANERMRITNAGNVGIGATNPRDILEIEGNMRFVNGEDHLLIKPNNTIHGADFIVGDGVNPANTPIMSLDGLYGGKVTIETSVGSSIYADKTALDIQGSQGQLFSVTDDLSGDIFSVADISGVPIMNVNSDGTSYFDGKVAIGTTNPSYKLEVSSPNNSVLKLINTEANYGANQQSILFQGVWWSGNPGAITNIARIAGTHRSDGYHSGGLNFYTYNNGTELNAMTMRYDGNVGIGTTSPASKLSVGGSATGFATGMQVWQAGQTALSGDVGGKAATFFGTSGLSNSSIVNIYATGVHSGQTGGEIGFGGKYSSGGNVAQFAKIRSFKTNNSDGGANYGGGMEFWTRPNGSAAVARMTILGEGNVGIGTTSPSEKLEVDGNVQIGSSVDAKLYMVSTGGNGNNERFFIEGYADGGTYGGGFKLSTRNDVNVFNTAVTVDRNGNVGIGTTTPGTLHSVSYGTTKLHVDGVTDRGQMILEGDVLAGIIFSDNGHTVDQRVFSTMVNDGDYQIKPLNDNGTSTAGGAAVTVLHGGNVGIGTTNPSDTLEVEGGVTITSETPTKLLLNNTKNGTWTSGEALGLVEFYGNDTSGGGAKVQSSIEVLAQDQYGAHFNMTFNLSKGSGGNAELMRLTGEGRLGIGTAGPLATLHVDNNQTSNGTIGIMSDAAAGGTGTKNMQINLPDYGEGIRFLRSGTYSGGAMKFYSGSSQVGSVQINSSSTSFNTTSDYRAKENVVPMENSINRLKELKPCRFNFLIDPENTVDGFIAHEAQEVVPEAITGEKDKIDYEGNPEYQGIDQSKLVPLLTSALQEAISKIEQLEIRIQTLENN